MALQFLAMNKRSAQTFHNIRFLRCQFIWILRIDRREIRVQHRILHAIDLNRLIFIIDAM